MHVIYTPSGTRGKEKKGTDSLRKSKSKSSLCEEKRKVSSPRIGCQIHYMS